MPYDGHTPTGTRQPFLEILWGSCCWPIGELDDPDFHFCGEWATRSSSYCEHHKSIAYIPANEYREAVAKMKREAGFELRRIAHKEKKGGR